MSGTAVYACEYLDCSIHHDNILFVFDIRGGTCEYPRMCSIHTKCLSLTLEVELQSMLVKNPLCSIHCVTSY